MRNAIYIGGAVLVGVLLFSRRASSSIGPRGSGAVYSSDPSHPHNWTPARLSATSKPFLNDIPAWAIELYRADLPKWVEIWNLLGGFTLTSAWRSALVNDAVGGAGGACQNVPGCSRHTRGKAIDVIPRGGDYRWAVAQLERHRTRLGIVELLNEGDHLHLALA